MEDYNDNITTTDSFTKEFFEKLIRRKCHPAAASRVLDWTVDSVHIEPEAQGVLSRVYRITIQYAPIQSSDNGNAGDNTSPRPSPPPSLWVAKLKRPELGLDWMFDRESSFYREIKPKLLDGDNDEKGSKKDLDYLPFGIPDMLYASSNCIIVEGIPNSVCYPISNGCPTHRMFVDCLHSMALWHRNCWTQDGDNGITRDDTTTNCRPGIGQRLKGLHYEHLFRASWMEFFENNVSTSGGDASPSNASNSKQRDHSSWYQSCFDLLSSLESLRLRDVTESHVHSRQCTKTFVHGDCHVANWLFPNNSHVDVGEDRSDKKVDDKNLHRKPVLIDWATCGYGNPMIDLVFFLVLSSPGDDIIRNHENWLHQYYQVLNFGRMVEEDQATRSTQEREHERPSPPPLLDYDSCQEWFAWCVCQQLLILVSYDTMCRSVALSEPDPVKSRSQLQHFQNVNRRMLLLAVHVLGFRRNNDNHLETLTLFNRHNWMKRWTSISATSDYRAKILEEVVLSDADQVVPSLFRLLQNFPEAVKT